MKSKNNPRFKELHLPSDEWLRKEIVKSLGKDVHFIRHGLDSLMIDVKDWEKVTGKIASVKLRAIKREKRNWKRKMVTLRNLGV